MPRPVKWRKVSFIPPVRRFVPAGRPQCGLEENLLKVEELEAIRLKDLEGLEQEECAARMEVSRQTFQRILLAARAKIADALANGKALRIEGGNFTRNICPMRCRNCGKEWQESYEHLQQVREGSYDCPSCGSPEIICRSGSGQCCCAGGCRHPGPDDQAPLA
ncbi:putative DNA-binding protein (UPF0251 family) [Hydrogenispora ethanolica]|uniref:UPF0251 protein EDC14_1001272 n=1 Tax=Hydrogenispora ethanolica TaxID=1082276 RepID=A0A4V2QGS9_HYDET|nr:DUF134 domain-containing protein [Hydrogenispora ethanolica]TCL76987.1 putative DNA-binding protein (UPF0251 family) [Hydrogenispora ethanolica]